MSATVVRARWYPAVVALPAGEPKLRAGRLYVLLCEGGDLGGLHVFTKAGDEAQVHLPIDWSRTVIPPGRGSRRGVDVHLADGRLAVVTTGVPCTCGELGKWAGPTWATTVRAGSS